jgi:uncharacterized protein
MRERLPLLIAAALLPFAIFFGALFVADGIRDRNADDVITVTGSAKKTITSDFVVWDASVSSQADTPAAALKRLSGWTTRIQAFLRDEGAQDEEITLQPVSTETVTADDGTFLGYRLTRSFQVRSSRVADIAQLVENTSKLLAQGIPMTAQPPQFIFTKLPSIRPELLAAATKDAQNRAEVLVGATGGDLGGLRDVSVGVFQVTTPNSTEVSDYGVYDTSTREKDVTAVVNVSFALE